MDIKGRTAFVTGANRGLGRAIALALQEAGATTVYAGARDPGSVRDDGLTPVRLDVTEASTIAAAAELAADASIVVNNAGQLIRGSSLTGPLSETRAMFETNVFGPIKVTRAFAPVLARNGGGALVDVLSIRSWSTGPGGASYAATKAALWSLTNAWRAELAGQGTLVVGVHVGMLDTDPMIGVEGPKTDPVDLAAQIVAALGNDEVEVLGDAGTRALKAQLSGSPTLLAG
ncbi:MAG: short-chain dehydrogenase [Nocardioidaceae bacterium]|nr:short-chain dehydrogenase [Nocardioidaceae bacterium]